MKSTKDLEALEKLSEEEILQRMLDNDRIPETTIPIKRLQIPVTLRGLKDSVVYDLREQCTIRKESKRGQVIERLDEEEYNAALIVAATARPNWGDPKLLAKYHASGPESVVRQMLLAGEMAMLADVILKLSGFDYEIGEAKN